ncbi:MAG: hypothetical protein ACI392_06765 [Paludibacteraceae bacterium]
MKTLLNTTLGFLLALVCVVSSSCANSQAQKADDSQLATVEAQDTSLYQLAEGALRSYLKAMQSLFDDIDNETEIHTMNNFTCDTVSIEEYDDDVVVVKKKQRRNIQWFEFSTPKGIVKLHTYMPKDSVQMLMGRPQATSIRTYGDDVHEEWKYKKKVYDDIYTTEFSFEFVNGELKSVTQY